MGDRYNEGYKNGYENGYEDAIHNASAILTLLGERHTASIDYKTGRLLYAHDDGTWHDFFEDILKAW